MYGQILTCLSQYAFASQVQSHGFDPKDAIIEVAPREGEFWLREEDILDVIEKEGSKVALVLFGGLSYYTGQWFPMKSVTKAAKAKVHSSCSEDRDVQAHYLSPGMHLWMGPGPCSWQRTAILTRLGRGFRRLVHIQVLELRTWRGRRIVYPREVERNGNTEVSRRKSAASIFSEPSKPDMLAGGDKQ